MTWWCSHDVARSLADFPELEYDLGLFTNDGRRKPAAKRSPPSLDLRPGRRPHRPPPGSSSTTSGRTAPRPRRPRRLCPGGRFAAAWLALAEAAPDGRGPQVLLRSRLHDDVLRAARGITTIEHVPDGLDGTVLAVAHPATGA